MERSADAQLNKSLQLALNTYVNYTEAEIEGASERATFIATRPLLIDLLQLAGTGDTAAQSKLNMSARSLVENQIIAVAFYGEDGQELARSGVFTKNPQFTLTSNKPSVSEQLIWAGQLVLRKTVEMKKEERVVGTIVTEMRLHDIWQNTKEAADLGETTDVALCANYYSTMSMQCLPTTLNPKGMIISQRNPDGILLPMARALEGSTGVVIAKDYRDQTVVAAYAPVSNFGLGIELKIDRAKLREPVMGKLRYLIPLVLGMIIIALLLLRWRLTPLEVQLTEEVTERKRAEASLGLRADELERANAEKDKRADEMLRLTTKLTEEVVERKHAEALLRNSMASLSATTETALDAIVQMDKKGKITKWSNKAEEIFGWLQAEAIGKNLGETIVPLQYREAHLSGMKHFLATGEGPVLNRRIEITGLHRNGHEFPIELSIAPFKMNGEYAFSAFMRDISEAKAAEDEINKLAFYDALTGLPNRRMLYGKLEDEMKRSDRSGLPVVLMLLDLDFFKEVNDKLGHAQGDRLLVEAARRITACVRETDTVARLGGDEFMIILSNMKDVTKASHIAENIIKSLAAPFYLSEKINFISGSLGVALYPNDAQNADNLIVNADQAMYMAKDAGRNGFSYFTLALQEAAQTRLSLISDLRTALPGKQFAVHYQPIVELATGKIYKAEALLRWQHPERGPVSPADFIPVAEEAGLIHEIGDWVFHEAIRELAHWRELFEPELQISVNVSPVQFRESQGSDRRSLEGFKKNWLNALNGLGLPGESVVFEITEGVLVNAEASVTEKLIAMRDAGVQVALDDFGTGYSSLSYLKKFDIDYLKIDQSFVQNLQDDTDNQALCEAIIVMAHKLGLKVIAEGVETEPQRDLLVGFGCDYAQGWLYSKAVPADEFEVLLKEQGKVAQ
ncbi:sensory box protein [Rhodobacterales bacterium HTCC2150]|nr:sensory box protein [Rhodobacterales bacterium HTCC2150] [Rhodobacteraceae bacterium HTCC2150]